MKLVLVHLGSHSAPHLSLNIDHLKKNFTNFDLYLIADDPFFLNLAQVKGINAWKYNAPPTTDEIFKTSQLNQKFRSGFWRYSFERILAFSEFHKLYPSEPIVHIESDILLLNKITESFILSNKLRWLKFNDTHDVGSIIFSPNSLDSSWLADSLMQELRNDGATTDMTGLKRIRDSYPGKIDTFPCFSEDSQEIIFDAAPIGMWLTGEDPRNHSGWLVIHRYLSESRVNPADFEYSVSTFGDLTISKDGITRDVMNLHVHSKNLRLFGRSYKKELRKFVEVSNEKREKRFFLPREYVSFIVTFLTHNNIFSISTWKKIYIRLTSNHGN